MAYKISLLSHDDVSAILTDGMLEGLSLLEEMPISILSKRVGNEVPLMFVQSSWLCVQPDNHCFAISSESLFCYKGNFCVQEKNSPVNKY